jgi:hypothetical protein
LRTGMLSGNCSSGISDGDIELIWPEIDSILIMRIK